MKKLLVLMLAALVVFAFVSCSKEEAPADDSQQQQQQQPATTTPSTPTTTPPQSTEDEEKPASPANTLYTTLSELYAAGDKSATTTEGLAELVKASALIPFSVFDESVEPGALDGFNAEITGFESAICIKPQVANPFIVYLFSFPTVTEEDEIKAQNEEIAQFVQTLKTNANLNWMEIGAADEIVCNSIGNTVFFCMARQAFAV